jgi:hypothetical protein
VPIDLEPLVNLLSEFVDELPSEATFRNGSINVRLGEAPQSRTMILAGFTNAQPIECLIKAEDCDGSAPAAGEPMIIAGTIYKIGTVTPLLSLSEPAGYRVTISRIT